MTTQQLSALAAFLLLVCPARAATNNSNTDWFAKDGYGVFVHFLAKVQNNPVCVQSLGRQTSWDECVHGQPYTAEFNPVKARFARVSALKLDGPDQKGTQMAVAELEIYED
jgi:hypothetical protein